MKFSRHRPSVLTYECGCYSVAHNFASIHITLCPEHAELVRPDGMVIKRDISASLERGRAQEAEWDST